KARRLVPRCRGDRRARASGVSWRIGIRSTVALLAGENPRVRLRGITLHHPTSSPCDRAPESASVQNAVPIPTPTPPPSGLRGILVVIQRPAGVRSRPSRIDIVEDAASDRGSGGLELVASSLDR